MNESAKENSGTSRAVATALGLGVATLTGGAGLMLGGKAIKKGFKNVGKVTDKIGDSKVSRTLQDIRNGKHTGGLLETMGNIKTKYRE